MITISLDNVVRKMISISLDNVIREFITKGKVREKGFVPLLVFKRELIFFIFPFSISFRCMLQTKMFRDIHTLIKTIYGNKKDYNNFRQFVFFFKPTK